MSRSKTTDELRKDFIKNVKQVMYPDSLGSELSNNTQGKISKEEQKFNDKQKKMTRKFRYIDLIRFFIYKFVSLIYPIYLVFRKLSRFIKGIVNKIDMHFKVLKQQNIDEKKRLDDLNKICQEIDEAVKNKINRDK